VARSVHASVAAAQLEADGEARYVVEAGAVTAQAAPQHPGPLAAATLYHELHELGRARALTVQQAPHPVPPASSRKVQGGGQQPPEAGACHA
jgi:hypothetical protein